ncbi:uncharacterized protein LOC126833052 isoform X3 [Adelges cooleyi]|uniref:uncharacterized protein LOC126833052 isoform X3 n=1 Tax=Adelges cooleyi TaxID=133065 RepID=UPI00217F6685|nr:uncharacterized protein LOC126833052 isoform X3 [Adelges cooleyi]
MFFKLSILLLSFIIAGISVLGESEDENEILKESYDDCRKWLLVPLDSTITVGEFWMYMGRTIRNFEFIEDYLNKNPAAYEKQKAIDLYLYGELFKNLCSSYGFTVKDCVALRQKLVFS